MPVSNNVLLWLVEVMDTGNAHYEDTSQLRQQIENLQFHIQRTADLTGVAIPEELQSILNDFQHGSNYIRGIETLTYTGGHHFKTGARGIVPNQYEQSFAGQKPIHIEHLVAENTAKGMENLKQFTSVSSVDIIQKDNFEVPIGSPKFDVRPKEGEVENFVAQLESETDELHYDSIEEIVSLFATDPTEAYKIGKRIHVEWNPSPLALDKIITLSPVEQDKVITAKFIGVDYDTNELIVVLDGEANEVYRVDQNNLLRFIGDLNIYDDVNFTAMVENIIVESRAKRRNKPERYTFSLYSLGENYVLVDLNIDGTHSTFVTSHTAIKVNLTA